MQFVGSVESCCALLAMRADLGEALGPAVIFAVIESAEPAIRAEAAGRHLGEGELIGRLLISSVDCERLE